MDDTLFEGMKSITEGRQQIHREVLKRIEEYKAADAKVAAKVNDWANTDLEAIFKDSKPEKHRLG
jgi:inorganic pyrophosphatase